jgi:gas vesicle protein
MKATAKLSTATINAIGAWSALSGKADNSKTKAIDSLHADGVTAAMLVAPAKGESTVLFDSVKVSIVMGFTVTVQALLKKDTKGLSEAQKESKRFWQMQIGSKMKDLRNALTRREEQAKDEMEGSEGAKARTASFDARLKRDLAAWIAKVEKLEGSSFSVIDMLKHLKGASALIK